MLFSFWFVQTCTVFRLVVLSGVVVSVLASINKVNLHPVQLVLRWAIVSRTRCPGSIPGAGHLFWYVTNQPPKANVAFYPSRFGKWVAPSAGKAKAGMVYLLSRWMWCVQVKLWNPLRTRAIPECLRGVFTTRRYTNPHLHLPLPVHYMLLCSGDIELCTTQYFGNIY